MADRSESTEPDVAADGDASDDPEGDAADSDHVADVGDGAGCTEIWEHLSERREAERREAERKGTNQQETEAEEAEAEEAEAEEAEAEESEVEENEPTRSE